MYKKQILMKYCSLFISAAFVLSFVISCGGGGGGGLAPFNYSDPNQAASASENAAYSVALAQSMSAMGSSMAIEGASQAGYSAPNKRMAPNTKAAGNIDPRLQMLVDKMTSKLQSQTIKNVMTKARLAKASQKTVSVTADCDNVGTGFFTVTGTDNLDIPGRTYDEATVTMMFTACRDNIAYDQISGTMQLYWKKMLDGSSTVANATLTNFTFTVYSDDTFTTVVETGTIGGTFNGTDNVTSGSGYANATFNYTDQYGDSATLFFNGLSNGWTSSTDIDGNTTDTTTVNGSFGMSYSDGYNSVSLIISLSSLEDKWTYYVSGPVDHWINGSIGISWNPAYCASGIITFTTAADTPLHYAAILDTCPVSGTLQVNNATIVYGSPITVTVGTLEWTYLDCVDMDMAGNGICL